MKHESFNESAEMYLKTVSELAAPDALAPISAQMCIRDRA